MSLAEEMLATMPLSDDSSTVLEDEEGHIVINESRQAIVPNELKIIAVTGDKDIETVTFDCVRYWDGHDLSTFAIYLNYVLPDMSTGTYIPKSIVAENDVFHFDWEIKNNITEKSGGIVFAVTAVKTKTNEEGQTVVDKQWSSLPNSDCSIALGLNIANVPDTEETQDILAQMSAILEQIHANVDEWIKTVVVQTTGTSQTQVMSQEAVTTSLNIYKVESIQQSNEYTDSKSNLLDKKILQNSNKISRNSKRITNLEQGLPDDEYYTDATVAYTKDVPSNALPYAEVKKIGGMTYKDGNTLRSAKVTEVKSVGVNLWDEQYEVGGYTDDTGNKTSQTDRIRTKNNISVNPSATYYFNRSKSYAKIFFLNKNLTVLSSKAIESGVFTTPEECRYIKFYWVNTTFIKGDIMLNEGATALPYTPYMESTLPIPEAVQALDGYGWSVNADRYNYIDLEKKQLVKRVEKVVLDGANCKVTGGDFNYNPPYASIGLSNAKPSQAPLSDNFIGRPDMAERGYCVINNSGTLTIFPKDTAILSVGDFNEWLVNNPTTFVYELAEPVITDISDLLRDDNFIEVEGNGSITAVNEYGYDVPSEIEYQLEV